MTSVTSPPPARQLADEDTQPVGQPDVFGVAALLLRVVLADGMIEDLHRLAHRNVLARELTGEEPVDVLFAGPSPLQHGDLAALANEAFRKQYAGWRAASNPSLWLLARLIGGAPADHGTLLSFLFFDPAFTAAAASLGHTHTRSHPSEFRHRLSAT